MYIGIGQLTSHIADLVINLARLKMKEIQLLMGKNSQDGRKNDEAISLTKERISRIKEEQEMRLALFEAGLILEKVPHLIEVAARRRERMVVVCSLIGGRDFQQPAGEQKVSNAELNVQQSWLTGKAKILFQELQNASFTPAIDYAHDPDIKTWGQKICLNW